MYLLALFTYSYFNENLPTFLNNYFKLNENIHKHDKRSASKTHIDYTRTDYGEFSLKFREAQIWNKLPNDLKIIRKYLKVY